MTNETMTVGNAEVTIEQKNNGWEYFLKVYVTEHVEVDGIGAMNDTVKKFNAGGFETKEDALKSCAGMIQFLNS